MLAKLTGPAVPEVKAVAAIMGTARGDRKEECESDSGATFHMSHTRAGMSAYEKASPGTNAEIADGNILVALVGRKQTVVRHQLFPQKPPGSSL